MDALTLAARPVADCTSEEVAIALNRGFEGYFVPLAFTAQAYERTLEERGGSRRTYRRIWRRSSLLGPGGRGRGWSSWRCGRRFEGGLEKATSKCVILGEQEVREMPKITLEVPSDVVDALRLPPREVEDEIRRELALALYGRGVLSLGKARLLAQMSHWQFDQLLGERQIPRHYTGSDLAEDIQHAHGSL